jgi:hypothetical protein
MGTKNKMFINVGQLLNHMRADVTFYMAGTVEARLPLITTPESPLRLDKRVDNYFILCSKDPVLDHFFVYGTPDSEIMSEDSLHIEAQKALGFQSESSLDYSGCNLNSEKFSAFRKIMEHLATNNIPLYMTATDERGGEVLVRGYNPLRNTEIQNPHFKQTLPDLLE